MSVTRSRNKGHLKKQALFLEELARSGNVSLAAKFAGLDRNKFYDARAVDPEFAQAWSDALDQAADLLEEEARRRGHDGVEEPVFGRISREQDGQIGAIRKYSDTLLIFLLKGCRPDKYRERREISGPGGGPLRVEYVNDWRANGNGQAADAALGTEAGLAGAEAVQRPGSGQTLAEDNARDANVR